MQRSFGAQPATNHAGLRADKRNIIGAVLRTAAATFDVNVIVMVVGRQYGVNLTDSEGSRTNGVVRRLGCNFLTPAIRCI